MRISCFWKKAISFFSRAVCPQLETKRTPFKNPGLAQLRRGRSSAQAALPFFPLPLSFFFFVRTVRGRTSGQELSHATRCTEQSWALEVIFNYDTMKRYRPVWHSSYLEIKLEIFIHILIFVAPPPELGTCDIFLIF